MDHRNDSFITEVDAGGPKQYGKSMLNQVRKEHVKVKEVVHFFTNKIETLIDKQRNEYIQAYESHMQDVQKELHVLREKVADIENDDTKNEKTESLKTNQKKYKEEALKLEAASDEALKKIRKLVRKIYTVEKSRDWMLKRLRQAKLEYNRLMKERNRLYEDWDTNTMSLSLASMSNASSYTLDIKNTQQRSLAQDLKTNAMLINRSNPEMHLSHIGPVGGKARGTLGASASLPALTAGTSKNMTAGSGGTGTRGVGSRQSKQTSGSNAGIHSQDSGGNLLFGSSSGGGGMMPWSNLPVQSVASPELRHKIKAEKKGTLPVLLPASTHLSEKGDNTQREYLLSQSPKGKKLAAKKARVVGADLLHATHDTFANKVHDHSSPTRSNSEAAFATMDISGGKKRNDYKRAYSEPAFARGTGGASNVDSGLNGTGVSTTAAAATVLAHEHEAEKVEENVALTRLISLRTRRQEVRDFLSSCARSLHRGPWCRVRARPLPELLMECEMKMLTPGPTFRDEELLQLVCELAVQPETYSALVEMFDNYAPIPHNYKSDDEILQREVLQPLHQHGEDVIADQLMNKYGVVAAEAAIKEHVARSSNSSRNDGGGGEAGFDDSLLDQMSSLSQVPSDMAVDFRNKLAGVLANNNPTPGAGGGSGQEGSEDARNDAADDGGDSSGMDVAPADSVVLDPDLKAYLVRETHSKHLSNMGFYEKDDFMNFD